MITKFNLAAFPQFDMVKARCEIAKRETKRYLNDQAGQVLAKLFKWAFSHEAVQDAIVKQISCSTPIGQMLNRHIDDCIDHADRQNIDADNVHGLDRYIEDALDSAFQHKVIEADDIRGLDRAIEEAVEEALKDKDEEITEGVIGCLIERLQK